MPIQAVMRVGEQFGEISRRSAIGRSRGIEIDRDLEGLADEAHVGVSV